MSNNSILQPRLKSRYGCVTCRHRRKKCDEQRPRCRDCTRLQLQCIWNAASQSIADHSLGLTRGSQSLGLQPLRKHYAGLVPRFSLPILPNLTSNVPEYSQALQYMWERGDAIIRQAIPFLPGSTQLNLFRPGIIAASMHPRLLDAYIAVASHHLSFQHWQFEAVGARSYLRSLRYIAERIRVGDTSDSVCVTAGVFSVYECMTYTDTIARKAHIVGFDHFMQAKLRMTPEQWSPGRPVLGHYIFVLATCSVFYSRDLLLGKKFDYVDTLIALKNRDGQSFAAAVAGIPTNLISAVFKLSFLRTRDTTQGLWLEKLQMLSEQLRVWQHDAELLAASNAEMVSLAQLYRLACIVFATKLMHRRANATDQEMIQHTKHAVELVKTLPSNKVPLFSLVWPLTFLCIAASDSSDSRILEQPIHRLIFECKLEGFTSVLHFIEASRKKNPASKSSLGLDILFCDDLLNEVRYI